MAKRFGAKKVSRAYQAGHDLELAIDDDQMLWIEGKARAGGLGRLYHWLNEAEVLIVKADRQDPLVVPRKLLTAEIAKGAA